MTKVRRRKILSITMNEITGRLIATLGCGHKGYARTRGQKRMRCKSCERIAK